MFKELDYDIIESDFESGHVIAFTFWLILLGKVWTLLSPLLWLK